MATQRQLIVFVAAELETAERAAAVGRDALARLDLVWEVGASLDPVPRSAFNEARAVILVADGRYPGGGQWIHSGDRAVWVDRVSPSNLDQDMDRLLGQLPPARTDAPVN